MATNLLSASEGEEWSSLSEGEEWSFPESEESDGDTWECDESDSCACFSLAGTTQRLGARPRS